MKVAKAIFIVIAAIVLALSYLQLKDAFIGVPYTNRTDPVVQGNNNFSLVMNVGCNRFYAREIGMIIEPPLFIESVSDIRTSISGIVSLKVEQDDEFINEIINLSQTGSSLNSEGVWSKLIHRFDPIGPIWCSSQRIQIEVSGLNFSLSEHSVTIYLSRDRRP